MLLLGTAVATVLLKHCTGLAQQAPARPVHTEDSLLALLHRANAALLVLANAAPTTAAAAWCGARATFPAVKLFVPPPRRRTADGCCSTPQRAGALCTTFSHGETTSAKNLVLTRHF